MRHFLTAGYLDEAAARQGRLVVLRPLPDAVVTSLLEQYRDTNIGTDIKFENTPVEIRDGYVRCAWYAPRFIATSIRFALALQAQTGCVIADIEHGRVLSAEELSGLILS